MHRDFRVALALAAAIGCYGSHGEDSDGTAETDTHADADSSADAVDTPDSTPAPWPVRFVLHFVSDVPGEELYVAGWDAAYSGGHWLLLFHDGSPFSKSDNCGICPCDDCPGCPVCGPPCMEATHLVAGSWVDYLWDGRRWTSATCPAAPPATCERVENGPAGAYTARFCYGTAVDVRGPCDETVLNITCQDVPFTLPDPDGLVEYTIDWGG
jgi:hypothetical protein